MDDLQNPLPPALPPSPLPASPAEPWPDPARDAELDRLRIMRRRLFFLLCAACLAFAVTTWLLVRYERPFSSLIGSTPAAVVRAQIDALNRGDLRTAYDLFSPSYRRQVSFDAFHELVITHRGVFRTREIRISRDDESSNRAVLDTHLESESGRRYLARFVLIRSQGHWLIDDVHWGDDPNEVRRFRA